MTNSHTRSSHLARYALAAAVAAIASAGAAARAEDWPTPGLDAAHARLSAERSGARFTDGRWTASFADGARMLATPPVADGIVHLAAPLIAGGRVYMAGGGKSDRVHAVDAATGTPVSGWPITLPAPAPDIAGKQLDRQRAVSSLASIGGQILLQTRLDD